MHKKSRHRPLDLKLLSISACSPFSRFIITSLVNRQSRPFTSFCRYIKRRRFIKKQRHLFSVVLNGEFADKKFRQEGLFPLPICYLIRFPICKNKVPTNRLIGLWELYVMLISFYASFSFICAAIPFLETSLSAQAVQMAS